MSIHSIKLLVLAGGIALAAACSDDSATTQQSVTLNFAARVNDAAFVSDCTQTYDPVGNGTGNGTRYKVTDYRMYIHDVHVHDAILGDRNVTLDQDGKWQYEGTALLDFEDSSGDCTGTPEMNTRVIGTVDAGVDLNNAKVCFEVGLPFEHNHLDPAASPSPLNVTGMMWVWKNGHKFIRVDGVGDPAGAATGYNLHLGSQGDCQMTAMSDPNSAPMSQCTWPNTFEACVDGFDVDNDSILVDVADVFAANDVSTDNGGKPGCQSFPGDEDCVEVFQRLGLDYSYGSGTTPGGPRAQVMFSQ